MTIALDDGRRGGWIQTYSGRKFYPLDPRPEDVCIVDIAHALSNLCRFTGHVREFYSVAQHCVACSLAINRDHALWALLHDAAEAYTNDISSPLKASLFAYLPGGWMDDLEDIESRILEAVARKFFLPPLAGQVLAAVKLVDASMLAVEARDLMHPVHPEFASKLVEVPPLSEPIEPWTPARAEMRFLERYAELYRPPVRGEGEGARGEEGQENLALASHPSSLAPR